MSPLYTIDEIAVFLKIRRTAAAALVTLLLEVQPPLAVCKGERPSRGRCGHGPRVYEIQPNVDLLLGALVEPLTR